MPLLLPHEVPNWVDRNSRYFITICCTPRKIDHLCNTEKAKSLVDSAKHYHYEKRWYAHLIMIMPDHFHALLSFSNIEDMKKRIILWKQYTARRFSIKWQRDFFEHRIRNDEEFSDKFSYVLQNPVRADLIEQAEDWPYFWRPNIDDRRFPPGTDGST